MSEPQRSFDVAVIGGGVIGLSIAWRAAQRGLRVTVLERGMPGAGTSSVAAGMIAPVSESRSTEQELLRLALASARAYPDFVAELREAAGSDPGYLECGTLAVASDDDEARALERELALRERLGLPVRRVRPTEARLLEPSLAPAVRLALEVPDDHAIDPRKLTAALVRAAARAGAELRTNAEVARISIEKGAVDGVILRSGEVVPAEQVVIAAGVWSGSIGGFATGAQMPVRPVKGQILRLRDPAGPGLLTHALRIHGSTYVVPRGDGRYVLGATVEERGFDTTVTAGPMFELLRDAIELLPGLAELVIEEFSAGLRPGTPDNAPVLGPGAIAGMHWATGHYRHGVLLTPISAEIVLAGLTGATHDELSSAFSPARFATSPVGV